MPAPTQKIQQFFDVAVTGGAGATLSKMPPLSNGDRIEGVTIYLASPYNSAVGGTLNVTIELYGCNSPPASATEAARGDTILPAMTYPLLIQQTTDFVPATGVTETFQAAINLTLPLWYKPAPEHHHIALVITSASYDLDGVVFVKIDRPEDNYIA